MQLAKRIQDELKVDIPIATIFSSPCLSQQAELIYTSQFTSWQTSALQGDDGKAIPLVFGAMAADRSQPLPLSFAQQRLWFLCQLDPAASLAYHIPAALRLTGLLNRDALTVALDSLVARH